MSTQLKQLSLDMGQPEYEMLQDIKDLENGFSNPAYGLSFEEFKKWLQTEDDYSRGKNLPGDWVPQTTYFLYVDGKPVGYGRVRHRSVERLEKELGAGNLGYGIAKKYRGQGYGNILFQGLLEKCREIGYDQIKLFPLKTNTPTVKIMLKNGGRIVGDFKGYKHIIEIKL